MSPEEICPKCGKVRIFHEKELKGVRRGEVVCASCSLEQGFYEFLAEVLDGKHPELIEQLKERLQEES